jgi:hypothetical protein
MILEPVNSSGVLTAQVLQICTTNCLVTNIVLNPGTAASVINLYDPAGQGVTTTTSASLVMKVTGAANASAVAVPMTRGIEFKNGCIAEVTGTSATAVVNFSKISG